MSTTQMEIPIKDNEKITWDMAGDWVQQLIANLNKYQSNGRKRSKAHDTFATNLLALLSTTASTDMAKITTQVLPFLMNRSTLSQGGWFRKQSYLYELCTSAIKQFFIIQQITAKLEKIQADYARKLKLVETTNLDLSKTITTQEKEIGRLNKVNETYRSELNAQQEEIENLRNAAESERAKYKSAYEGLSSQLNAVKAVANAHLVTIGACNKEIDSQRDEIENLKKALEEALLKIETNENNMGMMRSEIENKRSDVQILQDWIDETFQKSLGPQLSQTILGEKSLDISPEKKALLQKVASTTEASLTENFKRNIDKRIEEIKQGPDTVMGSADNLVEKTFSLFNSLGGSRKKKTPTNETSASSTHETPSSSTPSPYVSGNS